MVDFMKHTSTGPHGKTKSGFVHSRIDEDTKEQASLILEKIGLNVSDAIRLFLNQVVMRKGMPFPVCIPNAETIASMESADSGESLEEVTLDQLRTQFQTERKKIMKQDKKKKRKK
jgi:DNA-damage-inducible protein J